MFCLLTLRPANIQCQENEIKRKIREKKSSWNQIESQDLTWADFVQYVLETDRFEVVRILLV